MRIDRYASAALMPGMGPAEPLWQRAPTHDARGRLLTDFMMLIPRLRALPPHEIEHIARALHAVLSRHRNVVFADLNLKLNLLWVSLRPVPGGTSELVAAIRLRVPGAVLVAHPADPR